MNHIILHRHKGKPWRFEWNDTLQYFVYITEYGSRYKISFLSDDVIVSILNTATNIWIDATNRIHADCFDLGRVRITFKGRE